MQTQDIVQKLWNLCHILRDDGVTYHQYVSELTYLLMLKMLKEQGAEEFKRKTGEKVVRIPPHCRWDELKRKNGQELLDHYKQVLLDLAKVKDPLVAGIYASASTSLRKPRHLERLVLDMDVLDWYSAEREQFGDLYEGLLQKNANESKSGAGQYFTPRPLIDAMVDLLKPQPGEVVQDPAAGTGGFLIAADRYVKQHTDDLFALSEQEADFQRQHAFVGLELVPDTRRLALMNCLLHDIDGPPGGDGPIRLGDALTRDGVDLGPADLILTNPPFGTRAGGGGPTRDDFTFPTRNKQLAFLQHIYRALRPGGRAGVVVPDNVLFEEGVGQRIRRDLLEKCDLHTILRLPTGIFYAGGVKTNVLFFDRGRSDKGSTSSVWVYDLRAGMPSFGKRTVFDRAVLREFEEAYVARVPSERFRSFSLKEIEGRGFNLDISWLRDDEDGGASEELGEPEDIAAEIQVELRTALAELEELTSLLSGEVGP